VMRKPGLVWAAWVLVRGLQVTWSRPLPIGSGRSAEGAALDEEGSRRNIVLHKPAHAARRPDQVGPDGGPRRRAGDSRHPAKIVVDLRRNGCILGV